MSKLTITVDLPDSVRADLDEVCGPKKESKRGQWVASAIVEKLSKPKRKGGCR